MADEASHPSDSAADEKARLDADVLILGASFAGIEVVRQLAQRSNAVPLRILVVDRQTRHPYIPLVQERLAKTLDREASVLDTAAYVRSLRGASFLEGEVVGLDPERKAVRLTSGRVLRGRFVVVALGSRVQPPPSLEGGEHLLTYKFADEFARAAEALDRAGHDEARSIVVVGGGISGVELACELATRNDGGSSAPAKVVLISASERLLPGFPARVSARCEALVAKAGVELVLGARVQRVDEHEVEVKRDDGVERRPMDLGFWTGGLVPPAVLQSLQLPTTDDGWLAVGPTMQSFPGPELDNPDVFACGDIARILSGAGRWSTMQRAIECLWQASVVARNIAILAKEPPGYPDGVPSLVPHRFRPDFFYGISLGERSLVVYRSLIVDLPGVNHWFRRWLMRMYFRRYEALGVAAKALATPE